MKNSWLFPAVQAIHLAGIAALAGTIILSDLLALGLTPRRTTPAHLIQDLTPWTLAGFGIMALTGPLLFLADSPRYLANPAFLVKMTLLALAVGFHFTLHRHPTKLRALLSIAVWTLVVLAGRGIADFDV